MIMDKPVISRNFDVDDIRKIRDYNSARHLKMTHKEIIADIKSNTSDAIALLRGCGSNQVRVVKTEN